MLHEEPTERVDAVGLVASSVGKSYMAGAQWEDTSLLFKRVGSVSYLVSWLVVLRWQQDFLVLRSAIGTNRHLEPILTKVVRSTMKV